MNDINEKSLNDVSGGAIEYEMRKCICQRCGNEFEEPYPINTPPGFGYAYCGKGVYCKNCWKIAHDEMGNK